MDEVKKWALCVTFSTFIGAIIYIFSPKGALDKSMRTVISVFILAALLSPLINGNGVDFQTFSSMYSVQPNKETDIEQLVNEQIKQGIVNITKAEIEAVLAQNNIDNGQILIITDISEDGSIIIKQVEIILDNNSNINTCELSQKIKKKLGLNIDVSIKGTGD
ncbi:MAG TPA: hypothetical protein VFD52_08580 [Clostridia bacterium]|nr:hypothetical protein [Clostridia bacterium]